MSRLNSLFGITWYLALIFIFLVVLIVIKLVVTHTKAKYTEHCFPNGMEVGNAQLIGQMDNQNDYFSVLYKDNVLFAAIADGATNKITGKFAAVITIEILKEYFSDGLHKKAGIQSFFLQSFEAVNKRLNDNIYGNKVGATLIAVVIENGRAHFASVGDCSLFLYRDKEMINVNDIKGTEIQISKISLERNDIMMLASKGARESLTEMEILWHLSEENHPYNKCQRLVKRIRQKALMHQDNATIIVVETMV